MALHEAYNKGAELKAKLVHCKSFNKYMVELQKPSLMTKGMMCCVGVLKNFDGSQFFNSIEEAKMQCDLSGLTFSDPSVYMEFSVKHTSEVDLAADTSDWYRHNRMEVVRKMLDVPETIEPVIDEQEPELEMARVEMVTNNHFTEPVLESEPEAEEEHDEVEDVTAILLKAL